MNNPVRYVDPDGMLAESFSVEENDWKKNGDGTYTAEKGDSAVTLAEDSNISLEKANQIIESQLGKNYEKNGKVYSNVEVGDVVVNIEEAIAVLNEKESIQNAIDKDVALVDSNEKSIDSMEQVKDNIDAKTQMLVEQGEFTPTHGDPPQGPKANMLIRKIQDFFIKKSIDKNIQKKMDIIDSLNNEIQKNKNELLYHSYIH